MKIKRLDSRGIAHHFVLALVVVGIITAFTFQAVAGHAQVAPETGSSASASAQSSSTPKVTPSTTCTGTPTLGVGNVGPCVKLVQSKVGATQDSKFGPGTKAKVMAFQKSHGLVADGIVGPKTWAALTGTKVIATTTAKPSPLVYCTYTLNPGKRTIEDAHISAAACKSHNGVARSKPTPAASVPAVSLTEVSGTVSWGLSSSTTQYSSSVVSADGYVCTANTINNNKLGGVGNIDKYRMSIQQSKNGSWTTRSTTGEFHHDGNRDHTCFRGLTKGQTYRIAFTPSGSTQAAGSYTVWNYNHS
ncbi:MAG: peptidoglycan-binding protein [Candidatus Saccharibacteria bacterium]|nr:peptidoglycan-binding protein [Candidatus Saccharibacteria bacterium]